MITCTKCGTQSPDNTETCPNCQADLREYCTTVVCLQRMLENPRVDAIQVSAAEDACSVCEALQGTYQKENVPRLPHEGCSHGEGCRCFYEPILNTVFP